MNYENEILLSAAYHLQAMRGTTRLSFLPGPQKQAASWLLSISANETLNSIVSNPYRLFLSQVLWL